MIISEVYTANDLYDPALRHLVIMQVVKLREDLRELPMSDSRYRQLRNYLTKWEKNIERSRNKSL